MLSNLKSQAWKSVHFIDKIPISSTLYIYTHHQFRHIILQLCTSHQYFFILNLYLYHKRKTCFMIVIIQTSLNFISSSISPRLLFFSSRVEMIVNLYEWMQYSKLHLYHSGWEHNRKMSRRLQAWGAWM